MAQEQELRQRLVDEKPPAPVTAASPKDDAEPILVRSPSPSLSTRVFRVLGLLVVMVFLSSYLVTETWTWGYQGKYTNWRNWIPRREIVLTLDELAKYDGSDPELPIYFSIEGALYDVSEGRSYYGKGGGYSALSGHECARAFATSCLHKKSQFTHDLRDLKPRHIKSLNHWRDFYANHPTYVRVGRVELPPIDASGPVPPACHEEDE